MRLTRQQRGAVTAATAGGYKKAAKKEEKGLILDRFVNLTSHGDGERRLGRIWVNYAARFVNLTSRGDGERAPQPYALYQDS